MSQSLSKSTIPMPILFVAFHNEIESQFDTFKIDLKYFVILIGNKCICISCQLTMSPLSYLFHGPLTAYVKLWVAHATGNAGNVFPATDLIRIRIRINFISCGVPPLMKHSWHELINERIKDTDCHCHLPATQKGHQSLGWRNQFPGHNWNYIHCHSIIWQR